MKWIKRQILPWVACSILAGCGGVDRPHILDCIVNAKAKNRKCYQLDKDYNDDGSLKAGAVPVYRPNATLDDLDKVFTVDSVDPEVPASNGFVDALAGLKAWVKQLMNHYANCKAGN